MIIAIFKGLSTNPDLVEGSNFVSYLPAFIIAKLKRVPAVAWYPDVLLGTWTDNFGFLGILGETIERLTLKLPWDHFIALSRQTQNKLIKAGISSNRISLAYAGIELEEFNSRVTKFKHPTVICISRLVGYKRIQDLISAFGLVSNTLPQAKLIIIGSGPNINIIPHLPNIRHYQHLPRKRLVRLLQKSHVFCLPSVIEGFGLVTLESLAAGTPYVISRLPVNREITHHGQGGLFFTPRDHFDLAKKILRLLSSKTLRSQKIIQGRKLLKNYSWKKSAFQTLAIYRQLL